MPEGMHGGELIRAEMFLLIGFFQITFTVLGHPAASIAGTGGKKRGELGGTRRGAGDPKK